MGTLSSLDLRGLVRRHRLDTLVESGTGHGHSLIAALQVPELLALHSIEIDHETWHRARVVFACERRVHLYNEDSPGALRDLAEGLAADDRVLWFLDAHYPGSGRLKPLPMTSTDGAAAAVPLVAEVAAILTARDVRHDVLVVDDLCLFEEGAYESDAPELRAALGLPGLGWLDEAVAKTHDVGRIYRDGGYWIGVPRP